MEYDAVLKDVSIVRVGTTEALVAYGLIYGDKKCRFRDGDEIRTSYIVSLSRDGILQTRNTKYLIK